MRTTACLAYCSGRPFTRQSRDRPLYCLSPYIRCTRMYEAVSSLSAALMRGLSIRESFFYVDKDTSRYFLHSTHARNYWLGMSRERASYTSSQKGARGTQTGCATTRSVVSHAKSHGFMDARLACSPPQLPDGKSSRIMLRCASGKSSRMTSVKCGLTG